MKKTTPSSSEIASAVNLMAHPAAGAMALSALGFGIASQAFATWVGAMSIAAEVSQRFWQPMLAAAPARNLPGGQLSAPEARNDVPGMLQRAERFAGAPVAALPETSLAKILPLRKPAKVAAIKPHAPAVAKVPGITANAPSAPAKIEKPAQPDDFKAISGVGPKLEQVLNGLGIWTYAQIAAWDEADIAWVDDFLGFKGRVDRDGWIAQAAALAGKAAATAGSEG